ncbi:amino acid permease [Halpernia frigidisoli]|uniref:Amino acid/polyamine/organocation transporter, APC superfamily n=1 Tax=Halpernia frigidisoli TaxID=1125876 RepID=A0A1I3EFB2_9FLAO|nr:amino acid permease [Halpernia frigidisoli]SFH97682.1 amino acid/polyamine/organocation transporter, APC superfamily [Halpernia frigidisoli]
MNQLFRRKSLNATIDGGGDGETHSLNKVLSVKDLTFFGIAAIIGGGIFSAIGNACFTGGPAVILLYGMCAVACGFTAMCYAEFASRVPVSGSAYTYAYVSFGEIFAWIIGWALIMEYSIGNIYIAFSWSGYFTNLLETVGLHIPEWLTINYKSAHAAFLETKPGEGFTAWNTAPVIGGLKIIFDLPALLINVFITFLVYRGTKESKNFSNAMVYIKLAVILLVIIVGFTYVDIDNWKPFMPNGFGGVMAGVSAVFYAYIGFDAVSTLAEESKNPQRDLPRGMIYSLVICTVTYIILALVLTGMVSYKQLGVTDPLAEIFAIKGVKWMLFIVSISAVVAMTSVLLVFQMGQPRIWMTMSRDGLMPKKLAKIHPKYKTPGFATILTGFVVGVPIFFTDENLILDFTSIGTLFAFVLVCGGVLMLSPQNEAEMAERKGKFRIPYVNSKFIFPLGFILGVFLAYYFIPNYFFDMFADVVKNIPLISFFIVCAVISVLAFMKNLSLIPILGLISCCYLLTGMSTENWTWFGMWLVLGLIFYFSYGKKHSKLRNVEG